MNPQLTLPIGHPAVSLTESEKIQYLDALKSALTLSTAAFSPSQPQRAYTLDFSSTQIADFSKVYALWDGTASMEGNMVSIQMTPDTNRKLFSAYDKTFPIPKTVVYGPIENSTIQPSTEVQSGDEIGTLSNSERFTIFFLDDKQYYLDPLYYFAQFNNKGFWDIPPTGVIPLLNNNQQDTLHISGPNILVTDAPYLKLSGGSRSHIVMNPGTNLPPLYYSFLSSDTILIETINLTTSTTLFIKDVSDVMYRHQPSDNSSPEIEKPTNTSWNFKPDDDLRPFHLSPYTSANGKRAAGAPLCYELIFTNNTSLNTKICQDIKDIIRQEYHFHGNPFMNRTAPAMPSRTYIEFNNKESVNGKFKAKEIQTSNYDSTDDNWVLNAKEMLHVAEFIRSEYVKNVIAGREDNPEDYIALITNGLNPTSCWRNPERNEEVNGAHKSNHQYGKAIDIRPLHMGVNNNNPYNQGPFHALFLAGRSFLQQLIAANQGNPNALSKVEIFLERGPDILWRYRFINGDIQSEKGSKFDTHVTPSAQTDEEKLELATGYASHVHISWNGEMPYDNINLPDVPPITTPEPQEDPPFKNIIIIGTEQENVPPSEQIAINYAAESIKQYLEQITPDIPTEIHEVADAIAYLNLCQAFNRPTYKIKYFFSFTHAWYNGLTLKNYPTGIAPLLDQDFLERINQIYGIPADEKSIGDASTLPLPLILEYGPDAETQIMPHQINISNLNFLPLPCKNWIRKAFEETQGVFLVGHHNTFEMVGLRSEFCEAFAKLINQHTYGAFFYSFFFAKTSNDLWETIDVNRQTPPTNLPNSPIILVPGRYNAASFLAYFNYFYDIPLALPDVPEGPDLIQIYKNTLTAYSPTSTAVTTE